MKEQTKARIGVLLGNFFFGTSVIAVKHISPSLIPALGLTAIRIFCTTILFWLLYTFNPIKMGFTGKDFLRLFFCAIAGITLNQSFAILGMSLTSPIHASLLILATPITITILAAIILKERLSRFKVLGLTLGISGGALLVFSRDISSAGGANQSLGDMFVILGAISYSTYVVNIKPLMLQYKATHILQWVFLFGCFFSLPIGWKYITTVSWTTFDGMDWFCLVYVVLGATFFAYRLMNYGINKLGAGITGSYIYTQPFFATVASILILHETLNMFKLAAAALIVSGVFLTNYRRK
jgi:drug/metabolite transporter (DMT)-like permease